MSHTNTRLTLQNGTVIAYLAPRTRFEPEYGNTLSGGARARGRTAISRDIQRWASSLQVQGDFLHSDNLDGEHRTALQALFGSLPVTAQQQADRVTHYVTGNAGPFFLYVGDRQYTALTDGAVDLENGVYPAVNVAEMRFPEGALSTVTEFFLKFDVGVES